MGLDMYLQGKKFLWTDWENPENNQKEDGFEVSEKILRLGYWRKHPNLHGYIVETFADGVDECQDIELSREDIVKILHAIESKELPETSGFFFGSSDGSETLQDLAIFQKALAWLDAKAKGESRDVIYRASW